MNDDQDYRPEALVFYLVAGVIAAAAFAVVYHWPKLSTGIYSAALWVMRRF